MVVSALEESIEPLLALVALSNPSILRLSAMIENKGATERRNLVIYATADSRETLPIICATFDTHEKLSTEKIISALRNVCRPLVGENSRLYVDGQIELMITQYNKCIDLCDPNSKPRDHKALSSRREGADEKIFYNVNQEFLEALN